MSNLYFQSAFEYVFNTAIIAVEQLYPHSKIIES